MFLENFISSYVRYQTRRIMHSPQSEVIDVPQPQNHTPYLLYVHVPFCEELCPFCSFHRIGFDPSLARAYFKSLEREVLLYRDRGYQFDAVYLGGGTPTVLPEAVESLLALIKRLWPVKKISLETNPNHLRPEIVNRLKSMGVNRLSVGVQTFDDRLLQRIGRLEQYGRGEGIADKLRSLAGVFPTLNVDMMFNFPTQTEGMLVGDLEILNSIAPDQITYYPLMVSQGIQGRISEHFGQVDYRQEKHFYRLISSLLSGQYEPSTAWCFSRICYRNNRMIDEYIVDHDEYAGLGSGSFGYVNGTIYANTFSIPAYIRILEEGRLPVAAARAFSRRERLRYDFLVKLFGGDLDIRELNTKYGRAVPFILWKELVFFIMTGAVRKRRRHLALTRRGQYYWVILMREFFKGVNDFREHCRITTQSTPEQIEDPEAWLERAL